MYYKELAYREWCCGEYILGV